MATIVENQTMERTETVRDLQAELHNAQIRERFRELQQAQESQFKSVFGESGASNFSAPTASVAVEEKPAVAAELFTTATLDRVIEHAPVQEVSQIQETEAVAETFTVSRLAKVVAGAFAAVCVAMVAMICVNTQVIRQKTERLEQLNVEKTQLAQEDAAIQSRIENARSEEAIRAYVESLGVNAGN
ncbi:MAG: hypothetical protein IJV80_01820 [Clostridia bacterium]|nr:hypothetical protein [Clostridia bacterium]